MRQFLTILFLTCTVDLYAQNPPGAPAIKVQSQWQSEYPNPPVTRDSNFVFNKQYYDMEDRWVAIPKAGRFKGYRGGYILGFVYFDAETGYTMVEDGLFDVDANGHAFRDTAKASPPPYPVKWPFRVQWDHIGHLIAAVPDNMLNDLKLKKIPRWLPGYRQTHPDTVQTLAKRIRFGHLYRIYAKDVKQHVGEYVDVRGVLYGRAIKPDSTKPGTKMGLLYMGGGDYPNQKLIIVIRNIDEKEEAWFTALKLDQRSKEPIQFNINSAAGTIFLYEGKPAVEIKQKDLGQISFVDMTPTAAQLENYR